MESVLRFGGKRPLPNLGIDTVVSLHSPSTRVKSAIGRFARKQPANKLRISELCNSLTPLPSTSPADDYVLVDRQSLYLDKTSAEPVKSLRRKDREDSLSRRWSAMCDVKEPTPTLLHVALNARISTIMPRRKNLSVGENILSEPISLAATSVAISDNLEGYLARSTAKGVDISPEPTSNEPSKPIDTTVAAGLEPIDDVVEVINSSQSAPELRRPKHGRRSAPAPRACSCTLTDGAPILWQIGTSSTAVSKECPACHEACSNCAPMPTAAPPPPPPGPPPPPPLLPLAPLAKSAHGQDGDELMDIAAAIRARANSGGMKMGLKAARTRVKGVVEGENPETESDGRMGLRAFMISKDDPAHTQAMNVAAEIQARFRQRGGSGLRSTAMTSDGAKEDDPPCMAQFKAFWKDGGRSGLKRADTIVKDGSIRGRVIDDEPEQSSENGFKDKLHSSSRIGAKPCTQHEEEEGGDYGSRRMVQLRSTKSRSSAALESNIETRDLIEKGSSPYRAITLRSVADVHVQNVGDVDDNQDDHLNRRLVVLRPVVAMRDAKITPPENDLAPRHVLQLEARSKVDSHSAGEDGNAQHDFTSGLKHVYYHDSMHNFVDDGVEKQARALVSNLNGTTGSGNRVFGKDVTNTAQGGMRSVLAPRQLHCDSPLKLAIPPSKLPRAQHTTTSPFKPHVRKFRTPELHLDNTSCLTKAQREMAALRTMGRSGLGEDTENTDEQKENKQCQAQSLPAKLSDDAAFPAEPNIPCLRI
ncbi:hypothetical protein EIP91_009954 [Steccherinum ochraceum]|uniref:Uncharacterized protein n=1 Tax=Steccherinum ochraceum TaxID=92696 RepID=A0A4R0RAB7_9APHY|nr:hypothetical protein EIP91_009954 [Steccherinum ochraceum]